MRGGVTAQACRRLFSSTVAVNVPSVVPAFHLAVEGLPECGASVAPETSVRVSQLQNGVRVATLDKRGAASRINVSINSGSRDDTAAFSGLSHLYARAALRSSASRSEFRFVREMERIGSSASVSVTRENTLVEVDMLRENVAPTLRLVAEALLQPKFKVSEIVEAKKLVDYDRALRNCSTQSRVLDALYSVSFDGATLGLPVVSSSGANFGAADLRNLVQRALNPTDLVITGLNIDHQNLVDIAEETFGSLSGSSAARDRDDSVFVSKVDAKINDLTVECGLGLAVGFGAPAFASRQTDAALVMQALLGGGSTGYKASVGGGASLLNTHLVNKIEGVTSATSFYHPYSDAGLFGVYVECDPAVGEKVARAIPALVKDLASVSEADLERAKSAAKGEILAAREGRGSQSEDIARWLFTEGTYPAEEKMLKRISAVQLAEIKALTDSLLQQGPNMAAVGNLSNLPGVRQLWN